MKKQKVLKRVNSVVSSVLVVLLVSVAVMVVYTKISDGEPEVFGYKLKTVLSGSMEPGIQTGSLIAVKSVAGEERGSFQPGDVITFMEDENKLVTHRITEVRETGSGVIYTTKGDNNDTVDSAPVLAENVVGVYTGFTLPYAGYISSFAQSPEGSAMLLILPGILMFGYSVISIWKTLNELEKSNQKETAEAK
ncbi:signal peptidase I SipW [Lentibacillus sediminis]|uniref:signal peptidase I SipW n=1 Tax=Lentibacillus sediminis TaxID=1940529 RepID=UPI000C1BCD98|nr:signal peptidase I [Lentibacillus sediminis]